MTEKLSQTDRQHLSLQAYISGLRHEGGIEKLDATQLVYYFKHPKKARVSIQSTLTQLAEYKARTLAHPNTRVLRAYDVLSLFLAAHTPDLINHNAFVVVYGSMLYHDPVNLDYDILIYSQDGGDYTKRLTRDWNHQLYSLWEAQKIGTGGHISWIDSHLINTHLQMVARGNTKYCKHYSADINVDLGAISTILSGRIVSAPNARHPHKADTSPAAQDLRLQVKSKLTDPFFAATTAVSLKNVLSIRRHRTKL